MKPIWHWLLCLALTCASAAPTYGQVPTAPAAPDQPTGEPPQLGDFRDFDELDLDDLLNVTVSIASGKIQRAEEAPSTVSVVTDEDIRRMGARTLADVLQTVPGFEVLTNDLGRSRIAVRGVVSQHPTTLAAVTQASSENILVLFNGHKLNDLFTGGATVVNLEIPLYNIKQVEIIRGPGSALFGANAFLAVINLVPYTASNLEGVEVSAAGGSFETQQYHVLAGHTAGDLGVSASFQFSDTTGPKLLVPKDALTLINETRARIGLPPQRLSAAPRTTSGDRRGVDFSLNASYKGFTLNSRVRDERGGGFIGFSDMFGAGKDRLDPRQILVDAGQTFALAPRTTLSAKFSFTQNEVRDFLSIPPSPSDLAVFEFSTNSRRYAAELTLDQRISSTNQITIGTGYEGESTFNPRSQSHFQTAGQPPRTFPFPTMIPATGRKIASAFAQDVWNPIQALGITAGVRYDHYDDFGDTVNPRAGVVWRLPKRVHVKALYGRAFRAPTLTELFVDLASFSNTVGNPGLKPSTVDTFELALGYRDRQTRIGATYFTNVTRDFIVGPVQLRSVDQPTLQFPARFFNSPGFNVRGVELDLKRTFGFDHTVFANYTYQRATERSPDLALVRFLGSFGATAGARLPSHLATLGGTAGLGRHVSVTPTVLLRGQQPRCGSTARSGCVSNDPRKPVAAYGVVNLNVRLKELFDRLEVAATVGNVFDKRYFDPSVFLGVPGDYPKPGRNGLLQVTYKF